MEYDTQTWYLCIIRTIWKLWTVIFGILILITLFLFPHLWNISDSRSIKAGYIKRPIWNMKLVCKLDTFDTCYLLIATCYFLSVTGTCYFILPIWYWLFELAIAYKKIDSFCCCNVTCSCCYDWGAYQYFISEILQ